MESIGNIIKQLFSLVASNNSNYQDHRIKTNYYCTVCRSTGRPPNILGKFIKINDTQEKCNGCGTIFNVVKTDGDSYIPIASCIMIRD